MPDSWLDRLLIKAREYGEKAAETDANKIKKEKKNYKIWSSISGFSRIYGVPHSHLKEHILKKIFTIGKK